MTGIEIVLGVLVLFVLLVGFKSIRLVPQARVVIVQRLGRYQKTAGSGPVFVIPFVDKLLPTIDLREQVVPFPPQAVITSDNVGIQVATVVYYQIIDAKNATYGVVDLVAAMEQLTITTLRNVIGGLTLDRALTSREDINSKMRASLDEVTEGWGVRVTRVELKDIIPPHDVQQAMEKQMQAEREKRAAILRAEGLKQSSILQAEGEKQSAILTAEGKRQSLILQAEGDAQALVTVQTAQAQAVHLVFDALNEAHATPEILKYLYIQNLPKIAEGSANKLFIVPSELQNIAAMGATFAAGAESNGNVAPAPIIPKLPAEGSTR
ncbi:MAG TPA: SPFH domain-containing protein [Chloroflexota bacterium]|jgi:regulator of protease activity HflC (stomatin/prohibitin superfamily)